MKTDFLILFRHQPTALSRLLGVYTRRGIRIRALQMEECHGQEGIAQLFVSLDCDEKGCERLVKQLAKQVDVLDVRRMNQPMFGN